jgi:predicted acyltransferase
MEKITNRFLSLDVFRGMTICFMIIVNSPGFGSAHFAPLDHARWHGFTPTDLVFPSFLFVVGNAMSFSMKKYQEAGNAAFLAKVGKRTLLIFLLGYLMYWFPFFKLDKEWNIHSFPISHTRILGVLQRIALCYGIASLLVHYLSARKVYLISIALLLGYWIILLVAGDPSDPFSLTGNAGLRLDKWLFGDAHLYHGEGIAFDPEGLLSTMPAIVNVVIGYYAGLFVQRSGKNYESIARLMLTGSLLLFLAYCWNSVFPVNKKLWTSSFVLLTTGLDLLIMAALIFVIEIKAWNKGNWTRFFLVFGKNPLFLYLLSELLLVGFGLIRVTGQLNFSQWINLSFFQQVAPGPWGSFLFALCYMLLCWLVGWWLDKRKIYIRV